MYKVLILFLIYDKEKADEVYNKTLRALIKNCNNYEFTIVHIDNKNEKKEWKRLDSSLGKKVNEYFIGGDNEFHEFSGWDKGWKYANIKLDIDWDVVFILNDALHNSKPLKELKFISNNSLLYSVKKNAVIGWIDTYSRVSPEPIDTLFHPMLLLNYKVRKWVCTTLIVFPVKIFKKVFPLTYDYNYSSLYNDEFSNGHFSKYCNLNKQYQRFLINHQTKKWKKRYEINSDTYDIFKSKTRNVIMEGLLGYRIKKSGATLLNLSTGDKVSKIQRLFLKLFPFMTFRIYFLNSKLYTLREILRGTVKYYFKIILLLLFLNCF